jgi:hypothetical protein
MNTLGAISTVLPEARAEGSPLNADDLTHVFNELRDELISTPVSYTHLTLPTKA